MTHFSLSPPPPTLLTQAAVLDLGHRSSPSLDPPHAMAKVTLKRHQTEHITNPHLNSSRKLGVEENVFNVVKATFPKHLANITLSGENLKSGARILP